MAGVDFIVHNDVKILYEDYSETEPEELLGLIDKAQRMIATQPPHSVLALVNLKGAHYNKQVTDRMKEFVKANTPFIKTAAVFGMSNLQRVIYKGVLAVTGRKNLHVFASKEEALDFLVRQTTEA